ncbi:MAG: hypothetical protein WC248_00130 [Candidatus Methanomethylophilaceae archaeon]|jgi:hypothetical protein
MKRIDLTLLTAIILVAVIMVGQVSVYWVSPYTYDSNVEIDDDSITFNVYSSVPNKYTLSLFDNGDFSGIEHLYVYFDESYAVVNTTHEEIEEKISDLEQELEIRGFTVTICDALLLGTLMNSTHSEGYAIIMMTGAFPDTVYTGDEDDILFNWLSDGGSIYWIYDAIGKYSAHDTTSAEPLSEIENYDILFFNMTGAINSNTAFGSDPDSERDIGSALNIMYNESTFGISTDVPYSIDIGFVKNGFSSVSLTKYYNGTGMICVFGGDVISDTHKYLAQTIASGISYETNNFVTVTETVDGWSSYTLTLDVTNTNLDAYISISNIPVYGRYYSL